MKGYIQMLIKSVPMTISFISLTANLETSIQSDYKKIHVITILHIILCMIIYEIQFSIKTANLFVKNVATYVKLLQRCKLSSYFNNGRCLYYADRYCMYPS